MGIKLVPNITVCKRALTEGKQTQASGGKTAKEYIKSVFGLGSEQYKQVSKLRFRKAA